MPDREEEETQEITYQKLHRRVNEFAALLRDFAGVQTGDAIMVEEVAEAAAVPVIDDVRGKTVEMYVALKPGIPPSDDVAQKVSQTIVKEIGSIARPKNVWIVTDMPKTLRARSYAGHCRGLELRRRRRRDDADRTPRSSMRFATTCRATSSRTAKPTRELSEKEREEIAAYGHAE